MKTGHDQAESSVTFAGIRNVSPTVGVSPQSTPVVGVAIESDKVGWKCHDGVTYWR